MILNAIFFLSGMIVGILGLLFWATLAMASENDRKEAEMGPKVRP